MKVSKMIKNLEVILKEFGDIEVGYWADPYGSYNEWFGFVEEIEVKSSVKPTMEGQSKDKARKNDYYLGETVVSIR